MPLPYPGPLIPNPDGRGQRVGLVFQARARSWTTCSSSSCAKSLYHCPTARNPAGLCTQITASASRPSTVAAPGAQTGAAKTSWAGRWACRLASAARAVTPVARPSSVRSANSSGRLIRVTRLGQVPIEGQVLAGEVAREPLGGPPGDLLQRAGFGKQVGGMRYHPQLAGRRQRGGGLLVELDHDRVPLAHDEQRRCPYLGQGAAGEIGAAAAGYHRPYRAGALRGGDQRGARSGTRPEEPDRPARGLRLRAEPVDGPSQPTGEQRDVEAALLGLLLVDGEQVGQDGRQPDALQSLGDHLVTRAVPGAAAAVGEQH